MTQHLPVEPSSPLQILTSNATCVLRIDSLDFGFSGRSLFSRLSASIPQGVTLIKGGDGRGKTTLLRLLAGELLPDAGNFHIHASSLKDQAAAYRQQVFRCDTQSAAFDQHTPYDYFELQRSRWPTFSPQMLAEAVAGLNLTDHLLKNMFMLSTGSKRKVWLAAAFSAGADVTLLDEPFSALDTPSIRYVLAHLQQASSNNNKLGSDMQRQRAWLLADYAAPAGLALASVLDLGD